MSEQPSPEWFSPERFIRLRAQVRAAHEHFSSEKRKQMLLDLANLPSDSCAQFRKRNRWIGFPPVVDDNQILLFRDQLQKLWRGKDRGMFLAIWEAYCRRNHLQTWVVSAWADGTYSVRPNDLLLPLALAIAAGDWMVKMAVCANPACLQPYFLKDRKTQSFCDRPACSSYGQREHKKRWWHEHGTKWRERRAAHRKSANQSRGRE